MENRIIAIDQSTSATKVILFDEKCRMLSRVNMEHKQYYPNVGWVEHDAEEIYNNTVTLIRKAVENDPQKDSVHYSIAITNQRETVVVWNKRTGKPICHAIVWQCQRGAKICHALKEHGYDTLFREKTGLLIDPYFSASGVKWVLENIPGAKEDAAKGDLLMGTIDSWLVWKLTGGKVHATDYTNASRTLLFNIHKLDWDDEILNILGIPRSMMPKPMPSDAVYGETTAEGYFEKPVKIAGVIGDSHGALAGQMCFEVGSGKATYGTGSSVMINIGERFITPPLGLVTSVGFAALDKVFYAFEGNVHCTGGTLKWLTDQMQLVKDFDEVNALTNATTDTGGVYFVPAFAGLGAPWWRPDAKAIICGMTLATEKKHIVRAALESIAYQVKDLLDIMTRQSGIAIREFRVDGGPTKNSFLMQFQADVLRTAISRSVLEEASALGAAVMNGFARGTWRSFKEVASLREFQTIQPKMAEADVNTLYNGWLTAVYRTIQ
jgi:glycerol kinase